MGMRSFSGIFNSFCLDDEIILKWFLEVSDLRGGG